MFGHVCCYLFVVETSAKYEWKQETFDTVRWLLDRFFHRLSRFNRGMKNPGMVDGAKPSTTEPCMLCNYPLLTWISAMPFFIMIT